MKAGRPPSHHFPPAGGLPPASDKTPPGNPIATQGTRRRRWFRVLALLSPILLLGLAELGLRLAGYGCATSFFLEQRHEGRTLLIENPKFGWRYFPPAVARSPQPLSLDAAKSPGTTRIFVFGESAAMGDPEPAYGFPRQLERLLRAADPGHKFEVINCAMTAINSHVIRDIARDCAPRQADFWVIYAGNNEVVGPFGAGTVFGRQAPALPAVRAGLFVKSTRLGQWLDALRTRSTAPAEWQGMEVFLRNQVPHDAPALRVVYDNFARNLTAIIGLARSSRATVILATVPVNLKDSPPFGSRHSPGLSAAQRVEWDKCCNRGRQAQDEHRFADALAAYDAASQIDARFAELAFRQGACELALGHQTNAAADFLLARDLDTLRFRADSHINQAIRQVAAEQQITLLDAEQECARRSADGLPGEELFYDHVHLNFTGNYLVAALFAAEIEKRLKAVSSGLPSLTETDLARQLALTDFDRRRIALEMKLRLQLPPFSSQLNAKMRDAHGQEILGRLEARPERFVPEYQTALEPASEDWVLHANFGRLLEAAGDAAGATRQWQAVARLLPFEPEPWFQLGNLAHSARSFAAAQGLFQEDLKRNPDSREALNGLGLALLAQGHAEAAVQKFKAALRLQPGYNAARINLAVALANHGEIPAAMSEYRTALQIETNNVPARVNLARLLAGQGKREPAIVLFNEALALAPDEPVAHFDLANALVALDRRPEAMVHYRAAIRAKPDFADARFNLAMESARAGDLKEALAQFGEVVRLQPDFVNARFNYGVALARQERYVEAAQQFQETLRRQPDHSAAKSALERALQLAKTRRPVQN